MDAFFDSLIARTATIDELLSDAFEPLPGRKDDSDLATRRLADWCRSCAGGDWSLFNRRLERDGLSFAEVLARFATVRPAANALRPAWISDAVWIEAALRTVHNDGPTTIPGLEPVPFEHLLAPLVEQAKSRLRSEMGERAFVNLNESAHAELGRALMKKLSDVITEALYERFSSVRKVAAMQADANDQPATSSNLAYNRFVQNMRVDGFRCLFEEKPVLLRLISVVVRQWIDTTREFSVRLDADLLTIRRDILNSDANHRVLGVEGDISDPHNGGHSVLILKFEDGSRVVYKPKDLRLDVAWHALVKRLNRSASAIDLKTPRSIARDGYGWTEFIDHFGCLEDTGCTRFFRRSGAWLALFHCFTSSDMHEENIIAAGEHPVPIDIEVVLQASADEHKSGDLEAQAFEAAMEIIDSSVVMIGILPTYRRSPNQEIFAMGGMVSDWNETVDLWWDDINTDLMRPKKRHKTSSSIPNLPHIEGHYRKFGDHIESFVSGFREYANFLVSIYRDSGEDELFSGFGGLKVRKILRPTAFYYLLMRRLKNHRKMHDGVIWSAQADFLARLADWEKDSDPLWPLQRAERAALLALNIPHFTILSDGYQICDATGISVASTAMPGLSRARMRVRDFGEADISWQSEVIRQNTISVSKPVSYISSGEDGSRVLRNAAPLIPSTQSFLIEADRIATELARYAIRRGPAAAWIGFDALGQSDVAQLAPVSADLYNGASGIALFFAAHCALTGSNTSRELALAAVAHVRKNLNSRNAARMARFLGIGGATGLGSIIYAFSVMSKCLSDDTLLSDAHVAASLLSDDLIGADKQLDVFGGSAGGILGLLRLHRDSPSTDVLNRAVQCGKHLLAQAHREGNRVSWFGQGRGEKALNGMSQGAAGFAYALASLAAATGRDEFAIEASRCIASENTNYDLLHGNWPDFRSDDRSRWRCQWCHGATGIGISRAAMLKRGMLDRELLLNDVSKALVGVERSWPNSVDTLCCGTLGTIEFLCEAAIVLDRGDLQTISKQRLVDVLTDSASTGDYRWDVGNRQFNIGLFRGLSGVGYTLLRRVDNTLPNVLIWE